MDDPQRPKQPTNPTDIPIESVGGLDQNFLSLLRAANPGDYQVENEDTLRASNSNGHHHHNVLSNLSDLFAPLQESSQGQISSPQHSTTVPISGTTTSKAIPPGRPPKPDPLHKRVRSVSFDKEALHHKPLSDSRVPPSKTLNEYPEEGSVASHASSAISRPSLSRAGSVTLGRLELRQTSNRKLTIDDILGVGKYETEAETNILKALEEHQQQLKTAGHKRLQSETSTILSGVPDSLVHDFSIDGDSTGQDSELRGDTFSDDGDDNEEPVHENDTSSRQSLPPKQQTRPLLSGDKNQNIRRHRKTLSVEDRLAGLTIAMWNMGESNDSGEISSEEEPSPVSSGDHFGKTAAILASHEAPKPTRSRLDSVGSKHNGLPAVEEAEEGPNPSEDATGIDFESVIDIEEQVSTNGSSKKENDITGKKHTRTKRRSTLITGATDKLKDDFDVWKSFFRPRRKYLKAYIKRSLCYIVVPFVGVAAILFYLVGNPPTGRSNTGSTGGKASVSWWLLFVVRQLTTMSVALGLQVIIIDFLCIGTRAMLRVLGPLFTLLLVQSKGWPFVVFCWSILNFGVLYGDNALAEHWGYFQDYVGLFNRENPSGEVVGSDWNRRVLLIGVTVSFVVVVKRFMVGLLLGRQTFHHYGEQLAKVMNKMVLIGEVAQLSKRIYRSHSSMKEGALGAAATLIKEIQTIKSLKLNYDDEADDNASGSLSTAKTVTTEKLFDATKRDPLTGSLLPSEKAKLMALIERWEEPDRQSAKLRYQISISSVLKFRNALTLIKNDYPFSYAFGLADSRKACIDSSQEVYNRLLLAENGDVRTLKFETLALCALQDDGTVDQAKAKELIRVLRPDRDGGLSMLDFVKSVDAVYKEFRLLQASIENSSQIDRAFENILNVIFYVIVVAIVMSQLGFDPLALFLSLSSVILAFAFMIGSGSAKYFEGLLFILVRRPYGIGDLIHVSNVESNTSVDGSIAWVVNNVTLFETTLTWLPTQETASVSNGSLASSRIINWARSPNARFVIVFLCPIETKYETLELFKRAVEEFLKVRPREWLAFNAFRVIGVFADRGYIKVEIVVQHRDAWQNVGQVLDSKGNLISFCHEVQRMLGMEYRAPALPVDLRGGTVDEDGKFTLDVYREKEARSPERNRFLDRDSETDLFRSVAQKRHHFQVT